jgi:hypothetical protein
VPASRRQQAAVAARRARVLELRAAGMTFAQIADELRPDGMSYTPAHAVQDAHRALADVKTGRDRLAGLDQTLELVRLDELTRAATIVMRAALRTGADTYDPARALRAVDRLVDISDARRKLLGLDAKRGPVKNAGKPRGPDSVDEVGRKRRERRSRRYGDRDRQPPPEDLHLP